MLKGNIITLRPIQEGDLETLYVLQLDVEARGQWFPRSIQSLTALRKSYQEDGMWTPKHGTALMVDNSSDRVIGAVYYFPTVDYLSEIEIGYIVFDTAARKRGATTEALRMMTDYIFDINPVNRIRLIIATDNAASRRVAEKNGYRHEGTMRGAWFNGGKYIDGELYGITRADLPVA